MYKQILDSDSVVRSDGAFIPSDPRNTDWLAYQKWVEEGNTPDTCTPPPAASISVTPWQIRKAINASGLRSAVESAVEAADITVQDGWKYATEFVRTDPLIESFGATLGKTPAEIDALFALALTL